MTKVESLDRRKKRTRKLLKDALISLLIEKDFQSITVQDITNVADLNRATFYAHYHDKHDFLQQLTDDILNEFEEIIMHYSEDNSAVESAQQSYDTYVGVFEHFKQHADFYKIMMSPKGVPGFFRRLLDILHTAADRGYIRLQLDESQLTVPQDIIKGYISSAYLGVIVHWLKSGMPYTSEYMAEKLAYILSRK